jgi:hypothetical protein
MDNKQINILYKWIHYPKYYEKINKQLPLCNDISNIVNKYIQYTPMVVHLSYWILFGK